VTFEFIVIIYLSGGEYRIASLVEDYATSREVAGFVPDEVISFLN
jgi:hypothetical protein